MHADFLLLGSMLTNLVCVFVLDSLISSREGPPLGRKEGLGWWSYAEVSCYHEHTNMWIWNSMNGVERRSREERNRKDIHARAEGVVVS